ncbi:MAG: AI-2E family transporter [Candidatus Deferrimicrobium sp.]
MTGSKEVVQTEETQVPGAGSSPVPPLAATGLPTDRQPDAGDRVKRVRFEVSPKTLVALVLVVASLWLLIQLWPVLLVLIVALLVAGTLSPAVRWLEEKRVRRGFGIAIVFTAFFILSLLLVFFTIPTLVSQAEALLENEPALRMRLADYLAGSHLSAPLATWLRGLKADALTVAVLGIEGGIVTFAVRPWVRTEDYWDVYFATNENMKKRFDAEGIQAPVPRRDVHLHQA